MSYLPTADPDIWSVQEGNGAVAQRLLAASGAKLHLNTSVAAVQQAGEQYTLLLQDGGEAPPSLLNRLRLHALDAPKLDITASARGGMHRSTNTYHPC